MILSSDCGFLSMHCINAIFAPLSLSAGVRTTTVFYAHKCYGSGVGGIELEFPFLPFCAIRVLC